MSLEEPFEETLRCCGIPALLKENVDDLTVLIDGSPQVMSDATNLNEDSVHRERIAKSLVSTL